MKKIKCQCFSIALCFLLSGCGNQNSEVIFPLLKVAGQSKKYVSTILGTPTSCKEIKYGEKCFYGQDENEIVFVNEKADWITVKSINTAPFSSQSLAYLGLRVKAPDFKNSYVIRWSHIQGFKEVQFFPSGDKIFYAYINTLTK